MKLSLGLSPRDYSVAGGAVVYDTDAQAYFTANTAITSSADKNAINTFYLGLKSDGIYTKIKAMYLPIWGSASASKWNLVNPVDTNGAFRLTFTTGWTYSTSGITPNGTSAYADTFFNSLSQLNLTGHQSYYSRTQTTSTTQTDIGNITPSGSSFIATTATVNVGYFGDNAIFTNQTISDKRGYILSSKLNTTSLKLYRNGVLVNTNTTSNNISSPNNNMYIGARNNNGTADTYSVKQLSFASIGNGLTDTEASNFYTRVNTLMTYFAINV